jgi:protein-disulfide isomerase
MKTIVRQKGLSFALTAALGIAALLLAAETASGAPKIAGAAAVEAMLQGIPQQGIELGKPSAPVTLIEIVEPQCPGCELWSRTQLPGVISRYVRTGKIRIEYRGLSFLGPDSSGLLQLAQAAEGSGYATHAYLTAIAKAVPGLDLSRAFAQTTSGAVAARIEQARTFAQQYGINSTPTLAIRKTGDDKNVTVMANTSGQGLYDAINDALAGKPVPAKSKGFPAWAIVLVIIAGTAALSGAISLAVRLSKRSSAPPPAA